MQQAPSYFTVDKTACNAISAKSRFSTHALRSIEYLRSRMGESVDTIVERALWLAERRARLQEAFMGADPLPWADGYNLPEAFYDRLIDSLALGDAENPSKNFWRKAPQEVRISWRKACAHMMVRHDPGTANEANALAFSLIQQVLVRGGSVIVADPQSDKEGYGPSLANLIMTKMPRSVSIHSKLALSVLDRAFSEHSEVYGAQRCYVVTGEAANLRDESGEAAFIGALRRNVYSNFNPQDKDRATNWAEHARRGPGLVILKNLDTEAFKLLSLAAQMRALRRSIMFMYDCEPPAEHYANLTTLLTLTRESDSDKVLGEIGGARAQDKPSISRPVDMPRFVVRPS